MLPANSYILLVDDDPNNLFFLEELLSCEGYNTISANNLVNNKALTYLYSRITRTGLGTFDNDATACYDRIVPNVACS